MANPQDTYDAAVFLSDQAKKRVENDWKAVESEFSDLRLYMNGGRLDSPARLQLCEAALANLKRSLTQFDTYRELLKDK